MTSFKLLTTTAMVTGFLMVATPAKAEQTQSWWQSMTQSVTSWFQPKDQASSEVINAYVDEVTVAVPPMTGEQAANIEPAAGDYHPSLEEALQNQNTMVPGSLAAEGDQSFNAGFTNDAGSVAAFDDADTSAQDLADIQPAAGDAEEITDESIVVTETDATTDASVVSETAPSIDTMMERVPAQPMNATQDATEEAVETVVETTETVAEETVETTTETAEAVVEETTETVESATEAASDTTETAQDMAQDAIDETTEAAQDAVESATEITNDAVDAVMDAVDPTETETMAPAQ